MMFNKLSKEEIIGINQKVTTLSGDDHQILNPSALDEAVNSPGYGYAESVYDAAYILARAIAQAHPFADGNKRTASKAVKKFLKRNEIAVPPDFSQMLEPLIGHLADDDDIQMEEFSEELVKLLPIA